MSETPKKNSFRLFNPYVGGLSNGNLMTVQESASKVICSQSRQTTLFYLLGFFMFGPGLVLMVLLKQDELKRLLKAPLWLQVVLVFVAVILCIADYQMVKQALYPPRIEIDKGSGEIRFLAGLSTEARRRIHWNQMNSCRIEKKIYIDSHQRSCPNDHGRTEGGWYCACLPRRCGDF